ncbi:MAG: HAD family phosphatase, partial [Chloroflexi bacterium]|nr:HAD family phosphatase [Chloroflexota bacterium]
MTIAVIFDLDGLLVDTELISYKIYKEILADIGCEFSLEDYAKNLSGKTITLNVKYLIDNYRIPWTSEFGFSRIVEIEHGFIIQGVELKPGARELISWLKKNDYKIAMASSSIEERALNILRHHDLVDSFDELVF